jgi:N-acetylneuraminate synthase
LELNQIDFLRNRYPHITVGFSSHEYHSWDASIFMAYAKGARTFERHIDIEDDGVKVSPYCSTPAQIDTWFKAFRKAKEMCGGGAQTKRVPPTTEIKYLDALVRGVYAKRDLSAGTALTEDDVYLAIPLLKGQISCRELMRGEMLLRPVKKDAPLIIDDIDSPYSNSDELKQTIYARGLDPETGEDPAAKGSKGIDHSNKA